MPLLDGGAASLDLASEELVEAADMGRFRLRLWSWGAADVSPRLLASSVRRIDVLECVLEAGPGPGPYAGLGLYHERR